MSHYAAFFKDLDSIILPYSWNGKNARISKAHLQKSRLQGGLDLPVFKHCYWAANVRALMFWQQGSLDNQTLCGLRWRPTLNNSSLPAMLFSKFEKPGSHKNLCFVVKQSVRILNQVRCFLKLPNTSVQTPICFSHCFLPPWHDILYHDWRKRGLVSVNNLHIIQPTERKIQSP